MNSELITSPLNAYVGFVNNIIPTYSKVIRSFPKNHYFSKVQFHYTFCSSYGERHKANLLIPSKYSAEFGGFRTVQK